MCVYVCMSDICIYKYMQYAGIGIHDIRQLDSFHQMLLKHDYNIAISW